MCLSIISACVTDDVCAEGQQCPLGPVEERDGRCKLAGELHSEEITSKETVAVNSCCASIEQTILISELHLTLK